MNRDIHGRLSLLTYSMASGLRVPDPPRASAAIPMPRIGSCELVRGGGGVVASAVRHHR